jgi:hypothetical protein
MGVHDWVWVNCCNTRTVTTTVYCMGLEGDSSYRPILYRCTNNEAHTTPTPQPSPPQGINVEWTRRSSARLRGHSSLSSEASGTEVAPTSHPSRSSV